MEQLQPETRINKADNKPTTNSLTHIDENIPAHDETDGTETLSSEENNSLSMDKEAQLKKDKQPMYSSWQIVIKSLQFITKQCKEDLFNFIIGQSFSLFSMYTPIIYGNIIDAITRLKSRDDLIYYFKLDLLLFFSDYLVNQLIDFIARFIPNDHIKTECFSWRISPRRTLNSLKCSRLESSLIGSTLIRISSIILLY